MDNFVRLADVQFQTGLSKATIYRLIKRGVFPKSERLSCIKSVVVWRQSQINSWKRQQVPEIDDVMDMIG